MSAATVIAIAVLLVLVKSAWTRGKPELVDGVAYFHPSLVLRMTLLTGGVLFLFLAVGFVDRLGWRDGWMISAPLFVFAVLDVLVWPGTIVIDRSQIEQRRILRRTVVIPRDKISSIEFDSRRHQTSIYSINGVKITHQNFHAASGEFRRILAGWSHIREANT